MARTCCMQRIACNIYLHNARQQTLMDNGRKAFDASAIEPSICIEFCGERGGHFSVIRAAAWWLICNVPLLLLAIIRTQSSVVLVLTGIWGGDFFGAIYALWVICQKSYAPPSGCCFCGGKRQGRSILRESYGWAFG